MSEQAEKDSKTEEPTEKKVRDTVEKGQLPSSREVSTLFTIGAFVFYFVFVLKGTLSDQAVALANYLDRSHAGYLTSPSDAQHLLSHVSNQSFRFLLPLFAVLVLAGIAASVFQNAPRIALDRIKPKMERISLSKGLGRMFGSTGFVEFLKSVGKFMFAGAFAAFALRNAPSTLLDGMFTQTTLFGTVLYRMMFDMMAAVCLAMVSIAVADVLWTRFKWRFDLRMTRQEVKDEHKLAEGDPILKARMRSVARDQSRKRMMNAVPTATLIVANPTHFSVALRYDRSQHHAPVVVAKGQDLIALKIREIAKEHGVAVFEDVMLARSLYKAVPVDHPIPEEFFEAVAALVMVVNSQEINISKHRNA
jgi:flagellar biosynthetic protein FlhB